MNMNLQKASRLDFLDGVRGWASVMVLLSHTIQCFLMPFSPFLKNDLFRFISDGRFAVFIFFVLSGFVLSYKFIANPGKYSVTRSAAGRYFRFMIPVFASCFVVYFFIVFNLFYNQEAAADQNSDWLAAQFRIEPDFLAFLKFCIFTVFFNYNSSASYNFNLWTVPVELVGSMIVFSILAFSIDKDKATRLIVVFTLATSLVFLHADYGNIFKSEYYACFIFGYVLAEIYAHLGVFKKGKLDYLLIVVAILPIIFSTFFNTMLDDDRYRALSATILVMAVTFSPTLHAVFESTLSKFLGKISFPLYLIHMQVICSISSYLYILLFSFKAPDLVTTWTLLGATVLISFFCAYILLPVEKFSILCAHNAPARAIGIFRRLSSNRLLKNR